MKTKIDYDHGEFVIATTEMEKYYQPQRKDLTIPTELYSWQVFQSREDAQKWLVGFGYDLSDFDIVEYEGDDIEDYVILDAYGNTI